MNAPEPLGQRQAVVTGGSSGIGRAIALRLGASGFRVCLVGRDCGRLSEVAATIREAGGDAAPYAADLAQPDEVRRVASAIRRDCDPIDAVIHSAGVIAVGPTATAHVEDLDRQYAVNVRAPYLLSQCLLPSIPRGGHIVFVNSSAGVQARPGVGQYAATKHALKAIADSLREELRERAIHVLSVFPGNTATPMQRAIQLASGQAYTPDLYIDPADLATLVVTTLALGSAEVKNIDLRPAAG